MLRAALSFPLFHFPPGTQVAQAPGGTAKLSAHRCAGGSPAERSAFLKVTRRVEGSVHPRGGLSPQPLRSLPRSPVP